MLVLWFLTMITSFGSIRAQQYYDGSDCSNSINGPGSRYTCKSSSESCFTFIIYRANHNFNTISNVSHLFRRDPDKLLRSNRLSSSSELLKPGREVLIPVSCSCVDGFFQLNFSYKVPERTSLSEIACSVFEGLVKLQTLISENPNQKNDVRAGSELDVPMKCACPENFSSSSEVKLLVTYPLVEGDSLNIISQKFRISETDLWAANHLEPLQTVYPNTTILVPLKTRRPDINFDIPDSPPPNPGFLPTITVERKTKTKLNLYISVSVVGFFLIIAALISFAWHAKVLCRRKFDKLQSFNSRASFSTLRSSAVSGTSCLSPDLLVGIKYSLKNYTIDELKKATNDFSNETKIGDRAYKGSVNNVEMMIKKLRFEDTRQVIDVYSKINHINVVNLLGVCNPDNDLSSSYLLFELPSNGSIRDCLSKSPASLRWHYRTQIAFDIATGLHYLYYCIFPSHVNIQIDSSNIFITTNWRAKLTHITTNYTAESTEGNPDKVDIYAFGIVLLELISGKEDPEGKLSKDWIGFLGGSGGSDGGCFEHLRSFIDPSLTEDYPLAEALCLAVLAKACVEDDPLHRPSMDDILKVLVRLL